MSVHCIVFVFHINCMLRVNCPVLERVQVVFESFETPGQTSIGQYPYGRDHGLCGSFRFAF